MCYPYPSFSNYHTMFKERGHYFTVIFLLRILGKKMNDITNAQYSQLSGKHVVLGITGSIAAYKSADLARRLREVGAEIQVVMTPNAEEFITSMTMQAISGNPVRDSLFDSAAEAAMGHIELARWADIILIAPASADFIAHLNYGYAEDLLCTICLATSAPIALAPAMNQQMWSNSATQQNIRNLRERGIHLLGPAEGLQACGDVGLGRMLEPADIIDFINTLWAPAILKNKSIIITAGPTREAIDPVRYLSNYSSGKMGYALAEAAAALGAHVILISGPTQLSSPRGVERIDVVTADEMLHKTLEKIKDCDIFIAAAAVADYRVAEVSPQKLKKSQNELTLQLVLNPDILATVSALPHRPFIVGFAAETENVIAHAKQKLHEKNLDMIFANDVGKADIGFDSDMNQITAIWQKNQHEFPLMTKKSLAKELMQLVAERCDTNI